MLGCATDDILSAGVCALTTSRGIKTLTHLKRPLGLRGEDPPPPPRHLTTPLQRCSSLVLSIGSSFHRHPPRFLSSSSCSPFPDGGWPRQLSWVGFLPRHEEEEDELRALDPTPLPCLRIKDRLVCSANLAPSLFFLLELLLPRIVAGNGRL